MRIEIPEFSLVVLVGVSGSGKSSFARRHFKATEVLSSDYCRALVSCDENNQAVTKEAFEVLHYIAAKRLELKKLTVIDATNTQQEARKPILELARAYHCLPVAVVFDIPRKVCEERNRVRPDRNFGPHVLRNQMSQLRRSLGALRREGFRHVFVMESEEEVNAAEVVRRPLWTDKTSEKGPFDIIGDVHGCYDELRLLLGKLGYSVEDALIGTDNAALSHPDGRKPVFLGDMVDRGPKSVETLSLIMNVVSTGTGFAVIGNHDDKFSRYLSGRDVQIKHGLAETIESVGQAGEGFGEKAGNFIKGLVSHYVLDGGRLVVAHAGMKESMQGRASAKVRSFALYGETTGETDEFGLPVRYNWAMEYRGTATVVYGHTPVAVPEWLNNTICVDTGCVYGGSLSALRYPEREVVSVPASAMYYEPSRPLVSCPQERLSAQQQHDDVLDIADVTGKRIISTRLGRNITVREENSTAAVEVMSRFAVNPKWLIYLPPTMSPSETSSIDGFLEHPAEALAYYRTNGVSKVVCEHKHMGSRAVIVVCRDEDAAIRRFGVAGDGVGVCYTRTGRPFFDNKKLEQDVLSRVGAAVTKAGLWDEMKTDWICLDAEVMPWSMKAMELLKQEYAATASAGSRALLDVTGRLGQAAGNIAEAAQLLERFLGKARSMEAYIRAYRNYCWDFNSIEDMKIAPFHVLASEGNVHADKNHLWHMETVHRIAAEDRGVLVETPFLVVDTGSDADVSAVVEWWLRHTGSGGEGMVVKPLGFIEHGRRGVLQPAVKCRGREYLRII
ncbi:MAG: polynucleotide kinase-phosphatase, partial [Deltaproteobacteria bacterium]|nr:polynucleotide kinase-phosphatase [Deltaproteobacteria bacterium]